MSQETPTNQSSAQAEMTEAVGQVNRLLAELDGMVNSEQHAALTEYFAELAVLSAMRIRNQTQPQDSSGSDSETPAEGVAGEGI